MGPGEVLAHCVAQLLKACWDDAALIMSMIEWEYGCGDFKVVEPHILKDYNKDKELSCIPINARQQSIYVVKSDEEICSCGHWILFLYSGLQNVINACYNMVYCSI
jgi:hypothetical protein